MNKIVSIYFLVLFLAFNISAPSVFAGYRGLPLFNIVNLKAGEKAKIVGMQLSKLGGDDGEIAAETALSGSTIYGAILGYESPEARKQYAGPLSEITKWAIDKNLALYFVNDGSQYTLEVFRLLRFNELTIPSLDSKADPKDSPRSRFVYRATGADATEALGNLRQHANSYKESIIDKQLRDGYPVTILNSRAVSDIAPNGVVIEGNTLLGNIGYLFEEKDVLDNMIALKEIELAHDTPFKIHLSKPRGGPTQNTIQASLYNSQIHTDGNIGHPHTGETPIWVGSGTTTFEAMSDLRRKVIASHPEIDFGKTRAQVAAQEAK